MSSTLFGALGGAMSLAVIFCLIAALVFLIVRRRTFAAGGVGLLLVQHVLGIASGFGAGWFFQSRSMEEFLAINLVFQAVGNVLFLVGLGLILAEILVKRPARGLEGHP